MSYLLFGQDEMSAQRIYVCPVISFSQDVLHAWNHGMSLSGSVVVKKKVCIKWLLSITNKMLQLQIIFDFVSL